MAVSFERSGRGVYQLTGLDEAALQRWSGRAVAAAE
jgi:hypothetical protein